MWFPDPLEIEAALSDDMYEAWNETLEDASEMGRRERSRCREMKSKMGHGL